MSPEATMVDTNVLVYALDPTAQHHAACRSLLVGAREVDANLCLTSQVLAEFYAIETAAGRVRQPRAPQDAIDAIEFILVHPGIVLLPAPAAIVHQWIALVRRRPVRGPKIFDL